MQAYRTETVVPQDGELHLTQLPFRPGEWVEVIVLSRRMDQAGAHTYALKDTVVKYEAPTEPVAIEDRAATNWELIDAMTGDMIDTSDIPPLTDEFFATAKWRMPKHKVKVTVEIEPDVAEWFVAQGVNSERYLAAALRIYAQAHQTLETAEAT